MTDIYLVPLSEGEKREIDSYLDRFRNASPQDILRYMGLMRDFFYKHMTPEGRKFFEQSRLEDKISDRLPYD